MVHSYQINIAAFFIHIKIQGKFAKKSSHYWELWQVTEQRRNDTDICASCYLVLIPYFSELVIKLEYQRMNKDFKYFQTSKETQTIAKLNLRTPQHKMCWGSRVTCLSRAPYFSLQKPENASWGIELCDSELSEFDHLYVARHQPQQDVYFMGHFDLNLKNNFLSPPRCRGVCRQVLAISCENGFQKLHSYLPQK